MEDIEKKIENTGFSVTNSKINEFRNNLITSFWNVPKVINSKTMEKDKQELLTLSKEEREFLLNIFYFFLLGDDVVINFIQEQITSRVTDRSIIGHENIKIANEEIHSESYAFLLDHLAPQDKQHFIKNISESPFITNKINWCKSIFASNNSLARVFLVMIVMELLFFSTSFSSIFWFKNIKKMFLGVASLNEYIARDESQHGACYIYIYNEMITHKLPESEVHKIISEACKIECLFAEEITPTTIGINKQLLSEYAQFIADDICLKLNYKVIYGVSNPFPFMSEFTLERKVDFFKKKSTQYSSYVEEEFNLIF